MNATSNVIRQDVLEVMRTFKDCGKQDIINDIMRKSSDLKCVVNDYFNEEPKEFLYDIKYYTALKHNQYEHKCIQWRNVAPNRVNKRPRQEEDVANNYLERPEKIKKDKLRQDKSKALVVPQFQRTKSYQDNAKQSFEPEETTVSEAIATLKGDVKSLMNILKSDKLSAKDVSHLKIITNQLLSLM